MRTLWKGAISFGLVHVPVKMYTATEDKDVKFNYLHEKCKTPIKYERICPTCDTTVPPEEIVRGYEYEKGRYVILRDEDFEKLPLETARSIDIIDFVELEEIDPIYFDKSYYLAPGDGGQKAYELLKSAMKEANKIAIAKVVIRSKEAIVALRVYKDAILMATMHYPDEIRSVDLMPELNYQVKINETERKMALQLIGSLSEHFHPEKYTNEYRQALLDLIQAKIAGEEIEVAPRPETGKVVDLMEALKKSIELAKTEKERRQAQKEQTEEKPRKKRVRKTS
ncbi:non-homologous end joining protein Ku [Thermincola ferriacetica]